MVEREVYTRVDDHFIVVATAWERPVLNFDDVGVEIEVLILDCNASSEESTCLVVQTVVNHGILHRADVGIPTHSGVVDQEILVVVDVTGNVIQNGIPVDAVCPVEDDKAVARHRVRDRMFKLEQRCELRRSDQFLVQADACWVEQLGEQ